VLEELEGVVVVEVDVIDGVGVLVVVEDCDVVEVDDVDVVDVVDV
jgi:hypothetical protein